MAALATRSEGTAPQFVVLDGSCTLPREDIGGKAWGVNRMRALGLPVPPAIAVTTQACREYYERGRRFDERLWAQLVTRLGVLEEASGRRFGGLPRPLLVSVRSGAAHSMPGMMDTILDLGMNDAVERALAAEHAQPTIAADTRRRFVEQYHKVVLGGRAGPIPDDPWMQLRCAIIAVFESWQSPRAQLYRRERGLPENDGTAVIVQAMVFGNADEHSGTGVLFSRNPITGDPPPWGEWLPRGQGEEVVSGQRTPAPLRVLREQMPEVHAQLMRAAAVLEGDAADIQDIEFTVESGHLWLLQTRVAKRSAQAALHAAVAFAEEGLITREAALRRLQARQVRELPRLQLTEAAAERAPVARGEAASPGIAHGIVVIDSEQAQRRAASGVDVVLARPNTSPEDLPGIVAARAVLTEQGGSTSHAAVICRELGRPCIVGCGSHSVTRLDGVHVTLDGAGGLVWEGDLTADQADERSSADVCKLIEWGLALIPLRLLRAADEHAADADLDACGDHWRDALRPGIVVAGSVLDTDEGILAALSSGASAAIVQHRLPALLACLHGATAPAASDVPPDHAPVDTGLSELILLRLLGLKGRASTALLGEALDTSATRTESVYEALRADGWCARSGAQFHLTAAGRERLDALLGDERNQADHAAVLAAYEDFCVLNGELKQLLTAWQLRPDGSPNDHADHAYDRAVLDRLYGLHARVPALIARLSAIVPRLARYGERLARAASRIAGGDRSYVARISHDSYHSVWFELHEELIALAGLTREGIARQATKS